VSQLCPATCGRQTSCGIRHAAIAFCAHGAPPFTPEVAGRLMIKYIGIILALMPFIVLAKAIFMRSTKRSQAVPEFKKQLDLAVTLILVFIGCAVAYSLAKLIFQF
jgi:hypothetical protein